MSDSTITFLPLGAILQTLTVGGLNIVQSFPKQSLYESHNGPYFGETIGRVANRVSDARLTALNGGKTYELAANNGKNNLHGGVKGWGKRLWQGPTPVGIKEFKGLSGVEGGESVEFRLKSEDGDEGFPGEVEAICTYSSGVQKEGGKEVVVLQMEYEARITDDTPETVINMTNHSYFNLSGKPTIEGTSVTLCTNAYLPVDDGGIPTGAPTAFPNSVVAPAKPFTLGAEEPDIDDCFVVNTDPAKVPLDTRPLPLTKVVAASHPDTGINLEVLTTEPAFQFYTGKYIDVPEVDGVPARGKRSGFCVEPSRYVNACNVDEWKGMMLLKKDEVYGCRIVYRA